MLKIFKTDGFASFVEVVITSIIFIMAAFGVFTTISMLRPHGTDSARRLEAAYFGQNVIKGLRSYVDQRTYNTGPLEPNIVHTVTDGNYIANYMLTPVPNQDTLRISMNVYLVGETESIGYGTGN